MTDPDSTSSPSSCWHTTIGKLVRHVLCFLMMFLFIYSASVQGNDTGAVIMWIIFYICHGLINLVSLLGYHIRDLHQHSMFLPSMLGFCILMTVWSTILILIVAIQLSKVEDDDNNVDGGDNPEASEREEKAYELAGVILGFMSSSCHAYYYYKNVSNPVTFQSDNN